MISSLRRQDQFLTIQFKATHILYRTCDAEFIDSSLRSWAEIDPRLVEFDKEGPSSVHYERIGAVLTNLVKRQRDRIAELEAYVPKLHPRKT